jgi:hypothetical protein
LGDDAKLDLAGGTMSGTLVLNADPVDELDAATKQYADAIDSALRSQLSGKLNLSGGTMTGNLLLNGEPTQGSQAATKRYVDSVGGLKLNLTGGTLTGGLLLNADPVAALEAATKQYVDAADNGLNTQVAAKVNRSGDTMTGNLLLNADPTLSLQAATKRYADTLAAAKLDLAGGTMTGNLFLNTEPTVSSQAANKRYVDNADAQKLSLSGGTMTGSLVLNANPTAALGAATKQYVDTSVRTIAIPMTFAGAVAAFTTGTAWARFSTTTAQVRALVPPANTLFPGTTTITARYVVDYMTSVLASTGNIGLYDFSTGGTVAPYGSSSQPLATTAGTWTVFTSNGFTLANGRTFEIIVQRTGSSGSVSIAAVTLLVTYS